jgi:hypothetical protein
VDRRWLFSARVDVGVFLGAAVGSLAVALALSAAGVRGDVPTWLWLVVVVGFDVAHVWSTVWRAYFDPEEVRRRPLLYAGAPLLAFGLLVAAYGVSADFFWRALAYVAVFHFVRQQVGWMVLYGRRARSPEWEVRFDAAVMYAATLGPIVWWHAHLPRPFWWFREGDFVPGLPAWVGTAALAVHLLVLGAWLTVALVRRARGVPLHLGKVLLALATCLAWDGGIVLAPDDVTFTVMNVALHGVPYLALLFLYAQRRAAEGGYGALKAVMRAGLPAFLGLLWLIAWVEELGWDRLVWHEHPRVFGGSAGELPAWVLTLAVPLLALPQATHYLLDAFIWRTRQDPRLAERLGWASPPGDPSGA